MVSPRSTSTPEHPAPDRSDVATAVAGKAVETTRVLKDGMQGLDAGTSSRLLAAVARALAVPETAVPETAAPVEGADALQCAERLQAGFRDAVTDAIAQAQRANLAVPFAGDGGKIVWLHPDGTLRPAREP